MGEVLWFLLMVAAVEMMEELLFWRGDHLISAVNWLQKRSNAKKEKGVHAMLPDDKKFWETWGQANALYTRWADAHEINYYLLFVLYALDGQETMTQKKICDCTGLTKQTVNSVIRSLKNEGRVVLSPGRGDKREKQVALTEKGILYSQELLAPLHELERRVLDIRGGSRAQQMFNMITLFNTVFEKEMEKRRK